MESTRKQRGSTHHRRPMSRRLGVALLTASVLLVTVAPSTVESGSAATRSDRDPTTVALRHLVDSQATTAVTRGGSRPESKMLAADDPELRVTSTATSVDGTVTHVYVQQSHAGIDIIGAGANVAVIDGEVVHSPHDLVGANSFVGLDAVADLGAVGAVRAAVEALELSPTRPFVLIDQSATSEMAYTVSSGGVSDSTIPVRQVWVPVDEQLRLAWEIMIDVSGSPAWWQITIAADSGEELDRFDYNISHTFHASSDHADHASSDHADSPGARVEHARVVGAVVGSDRPADGALATARSTTNRSSLVADGSSYRVLPIGTESPLDGPRILVTGPADNTASPFGWHDTDGHDGAESTRTSGNNVDAYTDTDGDNVADAGSRPDGGPGLDFDFPFDVNTDPTLQSAAAVTQLFVTTNFAHDFLYAYGFDEAAGNFQVNNYGRGGFGGDPVLAEAQGTDARSNANFATPPDGWAPRMQSYFWSGGAGNVDIDGVHDQGVILHEYAHGLSTRLTGGRMTASCLRNAEQAGEGWSDYVSMMATMHEGDRRSDPRGIGNYVTLQGADGRGIRAFPYSTDTGIDPRTYAHIAQASAPHGVGSIWATMLWEMTWDLIDEYGFDADVVHGNGGNNLAMQLVVDGLKLQPCNPGFVDARDAILRADANLTGGANACAIWESFARRGLGASARQGSANDHTDGTAAFDTPLSCTPDGPITDQPAPPPPPSTAPTIAPPSAVADSARVNRPAERMAAPTG